VRLWLSEFGIDSSDAQMLFELLDHDGNGSIMHEEFVQGLTKLKEEARSQDLVPMITIVKRILVQSKEILQTCQQVAATVSAESITKTDVHNT